MAGTIPDKLYGGDALGAYAMESVESVAGMLQSGSISVIWSLAELQDYFGVTGDVAEIGVHHGRLFIMLCLAMSRGERAYAVDMFGDPPGVNQDDHDQFLANLARFQIQPEHFDLAVQDSRTLVQGRWPESAGNVRMVSVDGDHARDAVLGDLALAAASLNQGGVIIADDLFNPWYPTVTEAIYEYFRDRPGDMEPVAFIAANGPVETGAAKLLIARSGYAARYKVGLKLLNQDDLKHCDAFAGYAEVPHFYFANQPSKRPLAAAMAEILADITA
jgi:hypothetical protein